jgi:hypothetical protein
MWPKCIVKYLFRGVDCALVNGMLWMIWCGERMALSMKWYVNDTEQCRFGK